MARTAPVPNIPAIPGMCPGVAVLGGGGGGGGGSGKGPGNGNGGNGAGGEGGADGTNGDGRGAGNCGAGSTGSCNNCSGSMAAGDPVDVATGKVFTLPWRDLLLPGTYTLEIVRSYSSASRTRDMGMGHGWRFTFGWKLTVKRTKVLVITDNGHEMEMPLPEPGQVMASGAMMITRSADHFALRGGDEFTHYFGPVAPGSDEYRLEYVTYRARGRIALQYEHGRLVRAVDTVGRVVLFHRNAQGRISSIAVPSTQGDTLVFARYAYDDHGNMAAATDADGHTTYYYYDDDHKLVRFVYPNGLNVHFVYDGTARCIESWADLPGRQDPAVALGLSETLADGRTSARGILHCKLDFVDEDYVEVVDSLGTKRVFVGPNDGSAKVIGPRGGVTTREYDKLGRVIAKNDANGHTWEWAYDDFDKIIQEIDPEGNQISITRNEEGQEIELVDQLGGVTTLGRDAHGELTWVKDQRGGLTQFRLNARGLPMEVIDVRNGRHVFEYDTHFNMVRHHFPNGSAVQIEYDFWGRPVREIGPLGEEVRFHYSPLGRILSTTDPLGRTRHFEYDAMGNRITETQEDGSTIRMRYGGLGWRYQVEWPDGTTLRAGYNREGMPIWFENERGQRHEFKHFPDGLISWERNFHGHEYSFGYDMMGGLTSVEDASGKLVLERSPNGQVIHEEAPDGSTRDYTYNARGELLSAFSGRYGFRWMRDAMGNITSEQLQVGDQNYRVDTAFDADGQRTHSQTSLGLNLAFRRDAIGCVSEIWEGARKLMGITRDASSLPVKRELDDGGMILDSYDAMHRLRKRQIVSTKQDTSRPDEPQWVGAGRPGAHEHLYDYTAVDEIMRVTAADGSSVEYEYDVRRRLTRYSQNGNKQDFICDATNNYQTDPNDPNGAAWHYNSGNQLLQHGDVRYQYDERGYLVEARRPQSDKGDAITRYEWNGWGQLAAVVHPDNSRTEFDYDAFSRRLAKRQLRSGRVVEEHHYVWDRVSIVHDVKLGAQPGLDTFLFEENDHGIPIGQRDGERWLHYVLDVKGTPEELIDGDGSLVSKLTRTAHGRASLASGSIGTPFRYPGQTEDPETGLHYNRYRYYDPDTARYISPDPIGLDGGYNLYAYAVNPIGWVDPMGWQHNMSVYTTTPGFHSYAQGPQGHAQQNSGTSSRSDYRSGWGSQTRCPRGLDNRANCHTEQKFATDLMRFHRRQRSVTGQRFRLRGEKPPCPTCHAALHKAAQETGANITYSWRGADGRMNSVRYGRGSQPTTRGREANYLGRNGYRNMRRSNTRWGYSSGAGSQAAYSALNNGTAVF